MLRQNWGPLQGCSAEDGVGECLLGCELAFHTDLTPNIYVTDVAPGVDRITGLLSVEPHARYMRARWPNPLSGTQELRPVANVQPVEFFAPMN